jgi:SAM-dependent methyltransferase
MFTGVTRRITTAKLQRCIRLYRGALAGSRVLELGGGNSCFYDVLRERIRPAKYVIVDDNRAGLELFAQRHPGAADVELVARDVRDLPAAGTQPQADIGFSVGLIEHFDEDGTRAAIRAHFRAVRPGGLVILFFPTPTWLYRAIRRAAERLGIWAFPDERPLRIPEVLAEVERHGRPLYIGVNWWIGFTQGIVAAEVGR